MTLYVVAVSSLFFLFQCLICCFFCFGAVVIFVAIVLFVCIIAVVCVFIFSSNTVDIVAFSIYVCHSCNAINVAMIIIIVVPVTLVCRLCHLCCQGVRRLHHPNTGTP